MSWTTGTQAEAISINSQNGSAQNTFTSAQAIGPTTGAAYLPANFFQSSLGVGKGLLVKAHGVLSTTGTPNFTLGVSFNTTQGTYNSGAVIATTPATAMPSSVTNVPWELEVVIVCTATGGSGSFLSDGIFKLYGSGTSLVAARCSSSTANPNTGVTVSTESAYYAELVGTWSASSSSNSVTVYAVTVLGLN